MTRFTTLNSHGFRHLAVALVAVLLIAPATAAAIPSPPHEVFGTVTDQDGDPIQGLTVTVTDADGNSHAATTDADGYYEIKFPAEEGDDGETLTVEVNGASETTSFESGNSEKLDFGLTISSDDGSDDESDDRNDGSDDDRNYSNYGDDASDSTEETSDREDTSAEPPATTEEPSTVEPSTATPTTAVPTTASPTTDEPVTESQTASETGIPGFGLTIAVLALLTVAFVALRRE